VEESNDHVGDLNAGVVDVVLHIDRSACGAEQANEGIAENGVAEMADVRGFVGVDAGVLDENLACGDFRRRLFVGGDGGRDGSAIYADVDIARAGDLDLTNSGNAAVNISSVVATGTGVSVSGITTPATLNPSATATLSVTFAPTATGSVAGSIKVTSDAPGSPLTITVSGVGIQPAISISPASFTFGSVVAGQNSSKSFTVTNTGSASLTISQLSISAMGYSVNGLSVPSTVAAGSSVTFNAVFAPTAAGSLAGTVTIASNAPNSPATVALSGTGVAATRTLSFSAPTLAFGNVNVASTTATLSETITNTGNSSVQISGISVSGTGYSLSGAGGVTLNPSQTFTFSVIFDPTAAGAANGSITVTSNASGSPGTITLSGTGVQTASHTVSLSWSESGSSISGYNVYRSTTSGAGYIKVNGSLVPSMNYTDSAVQNGATYFYVTTAVDGSGNESAFSNEAPAVIPN